MSASERDIRNAAEVLLTGSQASSFCNTNHVVPAHPSYFSETVIHYPHPQPSDRMSVVRRFFCLLVTFDLLLTGLMWLICMMLVSGGDIIVSFTSQVVHYHIQTSLFDIVMAATSRFTILLLFYGLLRSNHWFAVAFSTAGTCAFLIAKVFVFDWAKASQPTFQVMLILVSFVLAWGEAWFLDFRVLSEEAKECLLVSGQESEASPAVRSLLRNLRVLAGNPESIANFYSPIETPHDSDDEEPVRLSVDLANKPLDYVTRARDIVDSAWGLINSLDWQLEKETTEGDLVHYKTLKNGQKVFRLTARVEYSTKFLLKILFDLIERMPKWNPTVIESERIELIDRQTDIIYQVSAAGGGGVVGSRDFVVLRRWEMRDNAIVAAGASILYPEKPENKKYIRGENYPGCWVMNSISGEENACIFQWLVNTNLNGWLPKYVVDSALTGVMLEFLGHLRAFSDY